MVTKNGSVRVRVWVCQRSPGSETKTDCEYAECAASRSGIRGTYQGLTATMMKQGTNQAIRFFVMESLKELYRGGEDVNKPVPKPITGLFGAVAGAASVFGNTPLDVIKTRMQVRQRTCLPRAEKVVVVFYRKIGF